PKRTVDSGAGTPNGFDEASGVSERATSSGLQTSSAAGVAHAEAGTDGPVVAGHPVRCDRSQVDAVAGAVDLGDLAPEHVGGAPSVDDLVGLESVLRRPVAGVADDQPPVALHIDPGIRTGQRRAVERVADDDACGGAFLDVDAFGRGVADPVAADGVAIALVRLAGAVGAPVGDSRPYVHSLAELVPALPGVPDGVADYQVVGAEITQVDAFVADVLDGQPLDDGVLGAVGDHTLLSIADGEANQPPVAGPVEV